MRAVDTNLLVRLLVRDDTRQAEAADAFVEPGAWVPVIALVEAAWVLGTVYDRNPKQIALAIEMLLNHRSLVLQHAEAVQAALAALRRRPSVGFSDSLILELARSAGHLPLGTFDRGLGSLDGAARL
jgi:predicted nucleic-acid-binding protein